MLCCDPDSHHCVCSKSMLMLLFNTWPLMCQAQGACFRRSSSTRLLPFVSSSKWVYLQQRHRSQTATTVRCNQLQWRPPSSPASRGRYQAGREGDPRSATSPRWISRTVTRSRSLCSKCRKRGGESRASRSVSPGVGGSRGLAVVSASCLKIHVYTEKHWHTGLAPINYLIKPQNLHLI